MQPTTPSGDTLSYLIRRGYTPELLKEEGVLAVPAGFKGEVNGIWISSHYDSVVFTCWSPGSPSAVHTGSITVKDYKVFYSSRVTFPVLYATARDWSEMRRQRRIILVEGVYDRVVVKRAMPEFPVFARLSKGVQNDFKRILEVLDCRVFLLFDNDDPGRKAADKSERALENLGIKTVRLYAPMEDPGDVIKLKDGIRQFREILERQISRLIDL